MEVNKETFILAKRIQDKTGYAFENILDIILAYGEIKTEEENPND
ncbi:hypothetical protein PDK35_02550 [Bacillus cereus group sp. TH153LC]|nr:hypothetical protein [Bacillus cereus group sp. TH153LC]MDA1658856.1 hypothetical protein [Bacillus cereus group sp. TH153LC]